MIDIHYMACAHVRPIWPSPLRDLHKTHDRHALYVRAQRQKRGAWAPPQWASSSAFMPSLTSRCRPTSARRCRRGELLAYNNCSCLQILPPGSSPCRSKSLLYSNLPAGIRCHAAECLFHKRDLRTRPAHHIPMQIKAMHAPGWCAERHCCWRGSSSALYRQPPLAR